jgi:hypothetical protein
VDFALPEEDVVVDWPALFPWLLALAPFAAALASVEDELLPCAALLESALAGGLDESLLFAAGEFSAGGGAA